MTDTFQLDDGEVLPIHGWLNDDVEYCSQEEATGVMLRRGDEWVALHFGGDKVVPLTKH